MTMTFAQIRDEVRAQRKLRVEREEELLAWVGHKIADDEEFESDKLAEEGMNLLMDNSKHTIVTSAYSDIELALEGLQIERIVREEG